MLKKIFQWVMYSSADPTKVSLTIKGVGASIISVLLILAGITHLQIGGPELTALVDLIAQFVTALLTAISLGMTIVGAVRKLYLTLTGQHPSFQ